MSGNKKPTSAVDAWPRIRELEALVELLLSQRNEQDEWLQICRDLTDKRVVELQEQLSRATMLDGRTIEMWRMHALAMAQNLVRLERRIQEAEGDPVALLGAADKARVEVAEIRAANYALQKKNENLSMELNSRMASFDRLSAELRKLSKSADAWVPDAGTWKP